MNWMRSIGWTGAGLVAALATGSGPLLAQSSSTAAPDAIARVTADLQYLADDAREGRGVGTKGLETAAEYIAQAFRQAGLVPGGSEGYFQPFEINRTAPGVAHTDLGGERVMNVIGVLPGRGALASQVVVLGAHYDHLGLGTRGYLAMSQDTTAGGAVHNGADDNASGTAALIETARHLAASPSVERRTFVFVAFTAEELGSIGSGYYTAHPSAPNDSTFAMINFDMVGRLRGDSLVVGGVASAQELSALIDSLNAGYGFRIGKQEDPWGSSDHYSFYAKRIPVLHLFTNIHEDYHRPSDDWQKLSMDGIARVAGFASELAIAFATRPQSLTFVDVPQPKRATGRRASLGTVPDMMESPGGVRLAGVRAGSAAEEAGLKAGDILVLLGDMPIKNLNDLNTALITYHTGQTVKVVFLRDGQRLEATATLK